MSARSATHTKPNGMLRKGDWIWIRGQQCVVRADAEDCADPKYVTVLVGNRRGGQWVETMLRARRRKCA